MVYCRLSRLVQLTTMVTLLLSCTTANNSSNFFSYVAEASADRGYGEICFNLDDSKPTCGWMLILLSSHPLTSIEVQNFTYSKFDDNLFFLGNLSFNADFVTSPPSSCEPITIFGPFGNEVPNITVTWFCVCDAATRESCGIDPLSETIQESTTPNALSLVPISSAVPTPTTLVLPAPLQTSTQSHNYAKSKTYLKKQGSLCYTGTQLSTRSNVRHFVDCSVICSLGTNCTGINFWQTVNECDSINEDTNLAPQALLSDVFGCELWIVE